MEFHLLYRTTNLVNGKIYIGVHTTTNVEDGYLGSGRVFLRALKKHGKENFKREILHVCPSRQELLECEAKYVTLKFVESNMNYNCVTGGFGSAVKLGSVVKDKIRNTLIGHNVSPETRLKISTSGTGRKHSAEHSKKISVSNTGKTHSEESKMKMRTAKLGKEVSQETRNKISVFWKGKPKSIEFRQNLKKVVRGRIHITNGTINRFVYETDIPAEGWRRGRVVNRKKLCSV